MNYDKLMRSLGLFHMCGPFPEWITAPMVLTFTVHGIVNFSLGHWQFPGFNYCGFSPVYCNMVADILV